jgi:hypothetical protein
MIAMLATRSTHIIKLKIADRLRRIAVNPVSPPVHTLLDRFGSLRAVEISSVGRVGHRIASV